MLCRTVFTNTRAVRQKRDSVKMDFINSFTKSGKPVRDLSRISALLNALGNPQNDLKFIHIAGTNGKGSTAQMFYEVLSCAGVKAGLFTSPYMKDYTDRIRFMGSNITYAELLPLCKKVESCAVGKDYSQFEITMAVAFLFYKAVGAEVVVLETGLGGMLDCTNVIRNPLLCVVTSISYDHMTVLGDTIEEISAQKAGIIKDGAPVILAYDNPAEAVEVVKKRAFESGSELVFPKREDVFIPSDMLFGGDFFYKGKKYELTMSGAHQVTNAVNVIEGADILKKHFDISDNDVMNGIKKAAVIGRTEIIRKSPLVILDGCHNEGGIKALSEVLKSVDKPVAIVGMLKDKNAQKALLPIVPLCKKFIAVSGFHTNAYTSLELKNILVSLRADAVTGASAISEYRKAVSGIYSNAVIFGSLYLVSNIKNS